MSHTPAGFSLTRPNERVPAQPITFQGSAEQLAQPPSASVGRRRPSTVTAATLVRADDADEEESDEEDGSAADASYSLASGEE